MSILNDIVRKCITQHEGGEKFFDALDEAVRNETHIMEGLVNIADQIFYDNGSIDEAEAIVIVVSGKFGAVFKNNITYSEGTVISVEGGLRSNEFTGFGMFEGLVASADVIFVDDSFYQGRTRDKIQAEVERLGGNFLGTVVAYDGSIEKDLNVESIFRYHR
jgi:hypothetical protein